MEAPIDNLSGITGVKLSDMLGKEEECRFGHICTSGCMKDFDCPCQAEHCCEITDKRNLCGELDNCEYCYKKFQERGELANLENDNIDNK